MRLPSLSLALLALLSMATAAHATGTAVPLWPGGTLPDGARQGQLPALTAYIPASNPTRTAVVICPGGAYHAMALDWDLVDGVLEARSDGIIPPDDNGSLNYIVRDWLTAHGYLDVGSKRPS